MLCTGTATEYSKKCCETLVTAGAVDILVQQIHLLNRGIPDQEVLKQVLITLRNIARYSNLRTVLLNTPGSVEIVFQELLRYINSAVHILHLSRLISFML
jgi:abnormal spindle-like microcephaly-associated protein